MAWSEGATGHVVDYARIEIASDDRGVEQATLVGLHQFRDLVRSGWPVARGGGEAKVRVPDLVWIDAGYMTPVVYAFCRESAGGPFRPAIWRGAVQMGRQWYNRPTHTGSVVKHIGEGFHVNFLPADHIYLMEVDADHWKTWVHQRLATPLGQPGSMTFYQAQPQEHLALAKHLTAETKREEFIAGKGVVTRWERVRRQNHWFDALYNAAAAGHLCGVRLIGQEQKAVVRRPMVYGGLRRPDGRAWLDVGDWRLGR